MFLFKVPPVISTSPSSVVKVTKIFDKVTLQCAARGSPVPSLEWSKDGVLISTNTTSKSADEMKGELVIPRFSPSDQGVYKCFFKNYDNGTAEVDITTGTLECSLKGPRIKNNNAMCKLMCMTGKVAVKHGTITITTITITIMITTHHLPLV